MKRKLIITFVLSFLLIFPFSAYAETVNGVDFNIPEDWLLVDSSDDVFASRTYSIDNQVILITVGSVNTDDREMQIINNTLLLDCESVFGEYDGFYLMTDLSKKDNNGFLTREQECVYQEDGWYYTHLCGINTGNAAITLVYTALTKSEHDRIGEYFDLANGFLPDLDF